MNVRCFAMALGAKIQFRAVLCPAGVQELVPVVDTSYSR